MPLDGMNGKALHTWGQSAHLIAEEAKAHWRATVSGKGSYNALLRPTIGSTVILVAGGPSPEFGRAIQSVLVDDVNHPEMCQMQHLDHP